MILSIKYDEPGWVKTRDIINSSGIKTVYVDRDGTGPLAEAINRGIAQVDDDYCWIITNVRFFPEDYKVLRNCMQSNPWIAAIHPAMNNSDHLFERKDPDFAGLKKVPFIEFTAPMVRTELLKSNKLDEDMPYWGHDLDWGFRMRKLGYNIAVHHGIKVDHEYIRNSLNNEITKKRWEMRLKTNNATHRKLIQKYGRGWRQILSYQQ